MSLTAPPLLQEDLELLRHVRLSLRARLGEVEITLAELLSLEAGATLALDRQLNEPVELYLNEALVARGAIVAVDDRFGVRITEIGSVS